MGRRRIWKTDNRSVWQENVHVVQNSKKWTDYQELVFKIINWVERIRIPHPAGDERILIECWWYIKKWGADCVNYHDLLADALKLGLEIDDCWFMIRDMWFEVDEKEPRVVVRIRKITPRSPSVEPCPAPSSEYGTSSSSSGGRTSRRS